MNYIQVMKQNTGGCIIPLPRHGTHMQLKLMGDTKNIILK